jgi:hypothetical protein
MNKKCAICSTKITRLNNGFLELLTSEEKKRLIGLKKDQSICLECKSEMLYAGIISPW